MVELSALMTKVSCRKALVILWMEKPTGQHSESKVAARVALDSGLAAWSTIKTWELWGWGRAYYKQARNEGNTTRKKVSLSGLDVLPMLLEGLP